MQGEEGSEEGTTRSVTFLEQEGEAVLGNLPLPQRTQQNSKENNRNKEQTKTAQRGSRTRSQRR